MNLILMKPNKYKIRLRTRVQSLDGKENASSFVIIRHNVIFIVTKMNNDLCDTTEWCDTRLIAHSHPITSYKITTSNVDFQSGNKSTKTVDKNNNNVAFRRTIFMEYL